MGSFRKETDSLGTVRVPEERLWGAQTQRSLEHFNISHEIMPEEMIPAYAFIKKAAAMVNGAKKLLKPLQVKMIVQVCDEILKGKHRGEFPLHVWMTGSGTQFNMNMNEVISNRICEIAKTEKGSKKPVHPNDDVNRSQSSNDTFPTAMHIAAAIATKQELLPVLKHLQCSLDQKAKKWKKIMKIGRTHFQDATPMTLGQEFSGYASMLQADIERIEETLPAVYELTLGGTAIGTGINAFKGFAEKTAKLIAKWTHLPFITASNKFAAQGSHDALVHLSAALKTIAISLHKIANDIRFLSCGPRAGIYELILPSNEPGSSIMPGKVNPTQCEALIMGTIQVMSNDLAVSMGGAGGHLEMNVYKPLIIHNLLQSIRILKDASHNFDRYLIKGLKPNLKQIRKYLDHSLMLVTALTPDIGYDKASQIAHAAMKQDITLKQAAIESGYISEKKFDTIMALQKELEKK